MLIREPGKNKSGLEKYCTIMMAIDVYWILSLIGTGGGRLVYGPIDLLLASLAGGSSQMIVCDHEPGFVSKQSHLVTLLRATAWLTGWPSTLLASKLCMPLSLSDTRSHH